MQTTRRELNGGWRFQDVPAPNASPTTKLPWLPAQVPGHVHLDLHRAGVIPDPFYRLNERTVAWVDETDFVYETTFHVDEVDGVAPPCAYLVFHGLDTLAEITLNGDILGRTDNAYVPHEFPVGGRLKAGEGEAGDNVLRVLFSSAMRVGRERHEAWDAAGSDTAKRDWFQWGPRSFVRKAQYQYGWDWGPELLGCGLWQKVELVTVPVARITGWKYDVEFTEDDKAVVTVTADVERAPGQEETPLETTTYIPAFLDRSERKLAHRQGHLTATQVIVPVPVGAGRGQIKAVLNIDNVRRWNPSGSDTPFIHVLRCDLRTNDGGLQAIQENIGLRTIELIREPDADGRGEGFKFRVNGKDLFIKGANWIPDSSLPGRISKEQLRQRVTQAKDAGFNMLRIWGGGLYESEDFYDICDDLGILVWQDFPYACAYYPDTGEYAEAARAEAVAAVRRIRNHPCLALWCGNNENDTMFHDGWGGSRPPRYLGEHLYHDILPAVVAEEDPEMPYWPSSPYGGPIPNDENFGDVHNWDVWHGRGDWTHYTENDARFCSEFGFASSCGLRAWGKCLAPEDKHPHSPAVRWHDKTRKGYEAYLGLVNLHFPEAQTLEDLVYYTQINQAEALKYGVEHYRRRKGRCWGTLFWQINDCWPTHSWAVIDSEGEPKAAWFAAKKFYAPVLLSLVREGESVTAHLVNDLTVPLAGVITWTLATLDGETLHEETARVSAQPNAASVAASFELEEAVGQERDVYAYARFEPEDGGPAADNYLLLAEPKDLRRPDPGLTVTVSESKMVSESKTYAYAVTVTAQRFAPYVWLRRTDDAPLSGLEDNFFHLRPGETRVLTVAKDDATPTPDALRGRLVVRTL